MKIKYTATLVGDDGTIARVKGEYIPIIKLQRIVKRKRLKAFGIIAADVLAHLAREGNGLQIDAEVTNE